MKNKTNGILWLIICAFFVAVLIRGINGKNWTNFKFWTWQNENTSENSKNIKADKNEISGEINGDWTSWTINASEISNIEIQMVSEKLEVCSNGSKPEIEIFISNNVQVSHYYKVTKTNEKLTVTRRNLKGIKFRTTANEVLIKIPEVLFDSLQIDNVSGSIKVQDLKARKININNVSGKIEAENLEGRLQIDNVSGKTEAKFSGLKNSLSANSVSGKILLFLPSDSDFVAEFETISGNVTSDFKKSGKKEGEITNGSEAYSIKLETVSGNIEIKSN